MFGDDRRRSLVWPLVLISAGVLFLLNNLGVVSWSIWSVLWRMWPVLLVAIGLDLVFGRRSGIWQAITVVMLIALFAGAFWLFDISENAWSGEKITKTVVHEMEDAEAADVKIKMNIGTMLITALPSSSDYFVTGEVEVSEFETLTDDLEFSDDTIYYSLTSEGPQYHPNWIFSNDGDNDKRWDLLLNPDVMLTMDINTGVGRTELNLSDLKIGSLDLNSGVGEVSVVLPKEGDFRANVKAGVGKLEIFLPEELAARITIDGGLGEIHILGDFTQRDGSYYTQNYSSSQEGIELYVDGGVGNIRVVQIDN